jgi:hypothetical protein
MFSAGSLFREIHDNDETFRLFCSIAMQGEKQGGWENGRIAALVSDPVLGPKIARHGADEDKHGRIFRALLRRRGLEPVDVPSGANYTMLLEQQGIGLTHDRLRMDETLTDRDVITYLVHSRVTEQRASEQMRLLRKVFGDHPDVGRAVKLICADEDNHLAYCHEELLRLADAGERTRISRLLRRTARAEIRVYRDVSLAVMAKMGELLNWPTSKKTALALGIRGVYAVELLGGRRRMVTLTSPARRDALGGAALRDPSLEY